MGSSIPSDLESYVLSILSDSNLPTGGFVASAGLESFLQHGLLTPANHSQTASIDKSTLLSFIAENLHSYSYLNGPFLKRSHILVERLRNGSEGLNQAVRSICEIDSEYDSMLLNHVSRRASKAQGVALLTLYSRAFARIPDGSEKLSGGEGKAAQLVETLKAVTRPRVSLEMGLEDVFNGHLPISFGVMCGALELSLERTLHLHLFLHSRSILSSAVRLNLIGPYIAHRYLLHDIKPMIDKVLARSASSTTPAAGNDEQAVEVDEPVNTWPLGEILAARHDCMHSRIFNS